MKLLLDANISWRLCKSLSHSYDLVRHVDHIDLQVPATDRQVWDWSKENDFIIVTNDEDFLDFSSVKGFPPKVVLLRVGNQSNDYLTDLLIRHQEDIRNLFESPFHGILEIY